MSIYIYLYTVYLYIYLYIYWKKNGTFSRSFAKERYETFLRSFPFFAKERCILCVLFRSLEKNGKERNILLGLISCQKLEKITEKNGTFFLKNGKERNIPNGKERGA